MHHRAAQLSRLLDRYAGPLQLYAGQWSNDAADVVQEAFVRWIEQPQPPAEPGPWLYRVVRNLALNGVRSQQRRARHEEQRAQLQPQFVTQQFDDAVDQQEIHAALDELPAELREVVVARIWGGLTLQQTAELTDSSTTTVHRRFESAMRLLRKRLNQPWSIE